MGYRVADLCILVLNYFTNNKYVFLVEKLNVLFDASWKPFKFLIELWIYFVKCDPQQFKDVLLLPVSDTKIWMFGFYQICLLVGIEGITSILEAILYFIYFVLL
jgi:hypothetical protein